ncbi:hypothetical protein SM907_24545 (plasmid) [Klebsiella aerogenes]|uniref:hypothetical protein n=1 Tax=Klebsiella aerogenes TaxID=548 RepID=UPI002A8066D3|nr:hypothetical protein [Klebsiella aerogenes]WPS11038.1 hypothetical protein SM907_24545 [Klebsiella aerogenes]
MQLEDYISAGRLNTYTDVVKLKPGEGLGGYNWNKAVSTAMQPLMYDLNVRRSKELRKLLQGLGQQKIIRLTSRTRIIAIILFHQICGQAGQRHLAIYPASCIQTAFPAVFYAFSAVTRQGGSLPAPWLRI